jgi:hypothetical protein
LSPAGVFADAEKRNEPPKPGLSHCRARYEQPFYPLKPKARLARALVELKPQQAPAAKVNPWHGALHCRHALSDESERRSTNSPPISEQV